MSKTNDNLKPSVGGKDNTNGGVPYTVTCEITGTTDLLFQRLSFDEVKARAAGDKSKSDDLESLVYRDDEGMIAIPTGYFWRALTDAAGYYSDPRGLQPTAQDLVKTAVTFPNENELCSLGVQNWDYEDKRRAVSKGKSRSLKRPAIKAGWKCTAQFRIILPEFVSPKFFQQVLESAGVTEGIGSFRPHFGRFAVTKCEVVSQ